MLSNPECHRMEKCPRANKELFNFCFSVAMLLAEVAL